MKKIVLMLVILLLCGCTIRLGDYDYYEYKDLEGNEGIAKECGTSWGNMYCDLKDGTRIAVQSYNGKWENK